MKQSIRNKMILCVLLGIFIGWLIPLRNAGALVDEKTAINKISVSLSEISSTLKKIEGKLK